MNQQDIKQAENAIIGVTLARLVSVGVGVTLGWHGDTPGAIVFMAVIPAALHFALPVIPEK
jgi:hypothetical protein